MGFQALQKIGNWILNTLIASDLPHSQKQFMRKHRVFCYSRLANDPPSRAYLGTWNVINGSNKQTWIRGSCPFRLPDFNILDGTELFETDPAISRLKLLPTTATTIGATTSTATTSSLPSTEQLSLLPIEKEEFLSDAEAIDSDEAGTRTADAGKPFSCPICGNEASKHVHYGGKACTSCRAFFRRSVQVSLPYIILMLWHVSATRDSKKNGMMEWGTPLSDQNIKVLYALSKFC